MEISEVDVEPEGYDNWASLIVPPSRGKSRRNGVANLSVRIDTANLPVHHHAIKKRALPKPPIIIENLCSSPDSFQQAFESVQQVFPTPPSAGSPTPSLSHSSPSSPASSAGELPETPLASVECLRLQVPKYKAGRSTIIPLVIRKNAFRGIMNFSDSPFKSGTFSDASSFSFMEDDSDAEDMEDEQDEQDDVDASSWYTAQFSARFPYTPTAPFPSTPHPLSPLDNDLPPARRDSVTSVIPMVPSGASSSNGKPLPNLPLTVKHPSSALDPTFAFTPTSRRPPRVGLPADIVDNELGHEDLFEGFEFVQAGGRTSGFEMDLSLIAEDPDMADSSLRRASSRFVRPPRPALLSLSPTPPPPPPARSPSPVPLMPLSASMSSLAFSFALSVPSSPNVSSPFTPSTFPESATSPDSELQSQQARQLRSRWSSSTLASEYQPPPSKSAGDMFKFYLKKAVLSPVTPPKVSGVSKRSFDDRVRGNGVRRSTSRSSNESSSSPRSMYSSDAGSFYSTSSEGLRRKPIPFALLVKTD